MRLGLAAVVGALALGCSVGLMATAAWLISRAAQHPPVLYLMVAVVAVRAFGVGRGVLRYAERLVSHDAAFRVLADLRVRVYTRLEQLAPAGLPAWRRGDLLARLVGDVDDVQEFYLRGLLPAVSIVLAGGAGVVLVWALLPPAGALLLVSLVLGCLVAPALWLRAAGDPARDAAADRGRHSAAVVDLIESATELTAYGLLDSRLSDVDSLDRRLARHSRLTARLAGGAAAVGVLAAGLAVCGGLALGIGAVRARDLPGVALAVVVLTPLALVEAIQAMPAAAQHLQAARSGSARVRAVLEAEPPVAEPTFPRPMPPGVPHLRLDGVSARWPGQRALALDGVDLDLPPGRRSAVVGPSGAGKSTLLAVLLRFLDPVAGRVTLDGVDTREFESDALRTRIAVCDQEPHLFDSTIAANLRLAKPDASAAEVAEVVRRAGLAGWVASLPAGLETPVGEHGAQVSGGERQRIALARALLADRPILLLDEPTAQLDEPTARALLADLLAATEGRTLVLVTHDPAVAAAVGETVVLGGAGHTPSMRRESPEVAGLAV